MISRTRLNDHGDKQMAFADPHSHSSSCDNVDENIIQQSPREPTEAQQRADGEIAFVGRNKRMADNLLGDQRRQGITKPPSR